MSIHTFYRLAVWLPLAVPAAVALLVHGLDINPGGPLRKIVQVLLMSLLYGGVPYAALALWATWWIGDRAEAEIRWLVFRAPLFMAALFLPLSLLVGLAVGAPGPFAAVGVLGGLVSIVVGYTYVSIVLLLRDELPPQSA